MSITQIRAEYAVLKKQIAALQDQMRVQAKDLMHSEFNAFFEQYEGVVENFSWTQYTPYFNDGESCRFYVNDVHILLCQDAEDENYDDDGCGSMVYDEDSIKDLERRVEAWNEYNRDPQAAARKYQQDSINRNGYDPFTSDSARYYRGRSAEQKMADWRPDYQSLESLQEELERARDFVAKHPTLCADFEQICALIGSIDDDLMEDMFGDHVRVVVTCNGIETEEYSHD
jgi:hypothetical protein